jgi:hypothetical protein
MKPSATKEKYLIIRRNFDFDHQKQATLETGAFAKLKQGAMDGLLDFMRFQKKIKLWIIYRYLK